MDECKPLYGGEGARVPRGGRVTLLLIPGRGLHSSTSQLNVSASCPMWWGALLVSVTKTAQVEHRCGRV
jgi:hypothetical protein